MWSVYAKVWHPPRNLARRYDTNAQLYHLRRLFRAQFLAFAIPGEFEATGSEPAVEGVAQDQHLKACRRTGQIECHVRSAIGHDQHRMPVEGLGKVTANPVGVRLLLASIDANHARIAERRQLHVPAELL